ncbi:MAG: hypothetical protein E6K87_01980 [Thaumarchaeota archaeon]|nr:MAG: hypothetical protein E6K87_01980 [Nitrososphaerota archaeon]
MPDQSCRICGGDLVKYSLCPHCRKITQYICGTCNMRTRESFHPSCLHLQSFQTTNARNMNLLEECQEF